jgi:hypothetical protein
MVFAPSGKIADKPSSRLAPPTASPTTINQTPLFEVLLTDYSKEKLENSYDNNG